MEQLLVSERYSIISLIGRGSFGVIFKVLDKSNNTEIALKLTKKNALISEIQNEVMILSKLQGEKGIPKLLWFPPEMNYYTMELLGPCIYDKFRKQNNFFTKSNLFIIATQLLDRLECIHNKSIVHRDLKPQQLLLGGKKNRMVYLVDFGLSKKYRSNDGMHAPYMENRPFAGTYNYASLNAHLGLQQSRRDDLESYCYILAFLYTGDLPWKTSKSTHNEVDIRRMKSTIKPAELFANNPPLEKIFTYTRSLMYDQDPNYNYIYSLLLEFRSGIDNASKFLRWTSGRYMSVTSSNLNLKIKKKRKPMKNKSKRSMPVAKVQSAPVDDMSITLVSTDYPEFQPRNSPPKVIKQEEHPVTENLKVRPEKSCRIF